MAKKDRIERSIGDKRAMLREQILLLTSYADSYDAGQRAFAKPMAASLRLLIHHHRNSISLLQQLGLRHAPTRMLVQSKQVETMLPLLREAVAKLHVGDPRNASTTTGPVVNRAQFDRVQSYIDIGLKEGARLVCGGLGRPDGLERGYFVKPTVFADVTPQMTIAQEEIFGPVLVVIPYETEDEAIEIANGTAYGLGAYTFSNKRANKPAKKDVMGSMIEIFVKCAPMLAT